MNGFIARDPNGDLFFFEGDLPPEINEDFGQVEFIPAFASIHLEIIEIPGNLHPEVAPGQYIRVIDFERP